MSLAGTEDMQGQTQPAETAFRGRQDDILLPYQPDPDCPTPYHRYYLTRKDYGPFYLDLNPNDPQYIHRRRVPCSIYCGQHLDLTDLPTPTSTEPIPAIPLDGTMATPTAQDPAPAAPTVVVQPADSATAPQPAPVVEKAAPAAAPVVQSAPPPAAAANQAAPAATSTVALAPPPVASEKVAPVVTSTPVGTSTAVVAPMQVQPASTPVMVAQPGGLSKGSTAQPMTGDWKQRFWHPSCGECCGALWCTSCFFGKVMTRNDAYPVPVQDADFCTPCCGLHYASHLIYGCFAVVWWRRNAQRQKFGIRGNGCEDCLASTCCPCFVLPQMNSDLKTRAAEAPQQPPVMYAPPAQNGMNYPSVRAHV
ncbi:uncharacterized protein RCC_09865 [Ramularia collo-cygni]|uniref:PLAC8 family protein n=1 Tax=Ramularia collo-cygni TaxID=112498 RepID=A0A2D3VQ22_9PEZI|nr:uncharacterized protein RCC_09865 [Ramularia collo-cygni]CZT24148.1 uncharacterized protein RCC_09865 [Ramularia collo-cygni]